MPLGLEDPSRSLISYAGSLAGARTSSNRVSVLLRGHRSRVATPRGLPTPWGSHASFPAERSRGASVQERATGAHDKDMFERAGSSKPNGTKPPLRFIGTLRSLFRSHGKNDFA